MSDSVTAVDYLNEQLELEREAREVMPYEPDFCTYPSVLRQLLFACLTCLRANNGNNLGVCYLCLIQCHLTHELVELFSRRNFVCDCGTTRMGNGPACALRYGKTESPVAESLTGSTSAANQGARKLPKMRTGSFSDTISLSKLDLPKAEDIESLENTYNHNFQGKFCSCAVTYNPLKETRTMHQCYFGEVCGEDWFHQDCILGYKLGIFDKLYPESGVNKIHELDSPGLEASDDPPSVGPAVNEEELTVPHFPELEHFGEFICWKCVGSYRSAFDELCEITEVVYARIPHFNEVESPEEWKKLFDKLSNKEPAQKKRKTNRIFADSSTPTSLFLVEDFKKKLEAWKGAAEETTPLAKLLMNYDFLWKEDPVYQPPEEDTASQTSSVGSLYDMGSSALLSLPAPQAIEGLHAYGVMKEKLRTFFKDFVDQKKVVTEEEVRDFFGKMKDEK